MITTATLAKLADLSIFTVRYYTRIGLLIPCGRSEKGYKIFRYSDVSRLKFIINAKLLGFELEEIRRILELAQFGENPCPEVREVLGRRVEENRESIKRLLTLQDRLECVNEELAAMNSGPTGGSIRLLIESLAGA
ncbi:MAG: MerR family DNA-binding protein [Aridibacter famidurans]|nr:MerR family DNA-binding protein [Aridibacter famidurans]